MHHELDSHAKTIVARLYVENGGSNLSTLPTWISSDDAQAYILRLQRDEHELNRVIAQDRKSRPKSLFDK
jgi:hypothetical protein